MRSVLQLCVFFFFQAEDGIRDLTVTGVQTCALPISLPATPMTQVHRPKGLLGPLLGRQQGARLHQAQPFSCLDSSLIDSITNSPLKLWLKVSLDPWDAHSSPRLLLADGLTTELSLHLVRADHLHPGPWTGNVLFTKYLIHYGERSSRTTWSCVWYACDIPELRFNCEHWHLLQPHHG